MVGSNGLCLDRSVPEGGGRIRRGKRLQSPCNSTIFTSAKEEKIDSGDQVKPITIQEVSVLLDEHDVDSKAGSCDKE